MNNGEIGWTKEKKKKKKANANANTRKSWWNIFKKNSYKEKVKNKMDSNSQLFDWLENIEILIIFIGQNLGIVP